MHVVIGRAGRELTTDHGRVQIGASFSVAIHSPVIAYLTLHYTTPHTLLLYSPMNEQEPGMETWMGWRGGWDGGWVIGAPGNGRSCPPAGHRSQNSVALRPDLNERRQYTVPN